MKQTSLYFPLTGVVVFLFAAIILWQPGPGPGRTQSVTKEHGRGLFLDVINNRARLIAVGEHGRILLSSDNGVSWAPVQSKVDVTLTCIYFLNDQIGWIAGYDGVVLKTQNGGLSWQVVRPSVPNGPAIFDIWFKDESTGLAVGADSSIYRTNDGGLNWNVSKLNTQAHLYAIVVLGQTGILIAGENNAFYLSEDLGQNWRKLEPGIPTSFFGAVALPDRKILGFGLRGRISLVENSKFIEIRQVVDENILAGTVLSDGRIILAGQRGKILIGPAPFGPFHAFQAAGIQDISSVAETADAMILTGESGIIRILKSELGF